MHFEEGEQTLCNMVQQQYHILPLKLDLLSMKQQGTVSPKIHLNPIKENGNRNVNVGNVKPT